MSLSGASGNGAEWADAAMRELSVIAAKCARAGWDGPESAPIDPDTVQSACRLLVELAHVHPQPTPVPLIVPEHDGDVSIGWFPGDGRMLDLSIGPHRRIIFAGQFSEVGAHHGWMPLFDADGEISADSVRSCSALLDLALLRGVSAETSVLPKQA